MFSIVNPYVVTREFPLLLYFDQSKLVSALQKTHVDEILIFQKRIPYKGD